MKRLKDNQKLVVLGIFTVIFIVILLVLLSSLGNGSKSTYETRNNSTSSRENNSEIEAQIKDYENLLKELEGFSQVNDEICRKENTELKLESYDKELSIHLPSEIECYASTLIYSGIEKNELIFEEVFSIQISNSDVRVKVIWNGNYPESFGSGIPVDYYDVGTNGRTSEYKVTKFKKYTKNEYRLIASNPYLQDSIFKLYVEDIPAQELNEITSIVIDIVGLSVFDEF